MHVLKGLLCFQEDGHLSHFWMCQAVPVSDKSSSAKQFLAGAAGILCRVLVCLGGVSFCACQFGCLTALLTEALREQPD